MGINTTRYLPPRYGSLRRLYHEAFVSLAYDIWRRSLTQNSKWSQAEQIRILECGSGPGYMLKFVKQWYPNSQVVGLDLDYLLINEARQQVESAKFVEGSALELPFCNDSYDLVIAMHIVEHLPDPDMFMSEVNRVLKRHGLLIIATPNPKGVGAKVMGSHWNGWSDHTHVNLQPPSYWQKLLSDYGLDILKDGTTGLSGIPIFRTMPFALINQIPLFLFGMYPWKWGESYLCISRLS